MPPKIQDKIHPTTSQIANITQNSISHQHCPTKNTTLQKMLQCQHYNMINHTMSQIPTIIQQNDNVSPSNFQ